jgi:hypothetical protein
VRARIEALETEPGIIAARRRHRHRHARAQASVQSQLVAERERLEGLNARWQQEKAWSTACWHCAPNCVVQPQPVEGTGSALEKKAEAAAPDAPADAEERATALAELRAGAGRTDHAAGRDAADPAHRGLPGRGQRGRRLDRHPGGPHGRQRDRDRAAACPSLLASA